jgi:hypothetical protein
VLILWGAVIESGFLGQNWLTFRQALSLAGHVRKGERGTTVVYADRFIPGDQKRPAAETGEEAQAIPFLKRFTVYNTDRCEGQPDEIATAAPPPPPGLIEPTFEALINATGITFRIGGDRAFYALELPTYNPTWGRFVSEDRIGLAGGINVYVYSNNNPVQIRDPSGNNAIAIGAGIGTLFEPGLGTLIGAGVGAVATAGMLCYFISACNPPTPTPSSQPTPPPNDPCASSNVLCSDSGSPKKPKGADPGPPCSGPNSKCSMGTRGIAPDPTNPGKFLCPDCFTKTFGEPPTDFGE